jgi:Xaa-Pro aminopeptidase
MLAPNPYFPPFSKEEYDRRYQVLREAMKEEELDCLIVYGATSLGGNDTGQINAQYLSNFAAVGHTYVVFPVEEAPTLHIGIPFHAPNARDIGVIQDVRANVKLEITVAQRLNALDIPKGRVGIVGSGVSYFMPCTLPYEHYNYLINEFPDMEFVNVHEWYENIRSIKSPEEIALIERAAGLTDLCHEEIFYATRPGVKHADIRRIAEEVTFMHRGNYCMLHLSSMPTANQTWPYPDFWPTDGKVAQGDLVMTEVPVGYGMYYTKIMSSYFVGEPPKEYREMFELAASVHDKVIAELKPGMKGSDVDPFVEPIREAGYFSAGLVSGWCNYNGPPFVGQTHEEFPTPEPQSHLDLVFKPGLCVIVMAYLMSLDLQKGLWVGSTCVFTEDGLKRLNKYPVNELRVV